MLFSLTFLHKFFVENKQMFDITLKIGTAMMLAGPSSCGKSSFVKNLIMSRDILCNKPSLNVYIVCSNVQNIYEDMVKNKNVKKIFYKMPSKNEILQIAKYGRRTGGTILILDDLLTEIAKNNMLIQEIFTEMAHHQKLTVVLCVQNLFYQNGIFRTLSLNSGYLVPFKNLRDMKQIDFIAYRSYVVDPKVVIKAYKDATYKPYSYLFMDFTQTTPDFLRLKTDIFPSHIDKIPPAIYLPNEDDRTLKRRKIY